MGEYYGKLLISEEAILEFWSASAGKGYLQNASISGSEFFLEWGGMNHLPNTTLLPISDVVSKVGFPLPVPHRAFVDKNRDALCVIFKTSEPWTGLHPRLSNGDLHQIGMISSLGMQSH